MSILFIGGYQIVPRLLNRFEGLSLAPYARYLFPLPPAWFAGMDSWVAGEQPASGALLGAFGLLMTAALSYIAIGKLAPSYGEGLTRLSESRGRTSKPAKVSRRPTSICNPILRWWLRDPVEQWAFQLARAYMRRDRDIKLRLYPIAHNLSDISVDEFAVDRNRHGFSALLPLMTIWILGMMPLQALQTLQMSQDYLAADIFAIAPLPSAAPIFHGVRKATIYYLLFPALCVAAVLIAYLAPGGNSGCVARFAWSRGPSGSVPVCARSSTGIFAAIAARHSRRAVFAKRQSDVHDYVSDGRSARRFVPCLGVRIYVVPGHD